MGFSLVKAPNNLPDNLPSSKTNTAQRAPSPDSPAAWRLVLNVGEDRKPLNLSVSERMTIGRAGSDPSLPQPTIDLSRFGALDLGVSRLHAALTFHDQTLFVEDLDSTNGVRINGLRIEPSTPIRLRNGDELELGQLRVSVRLMRAPKPR